MNFKIEAKWAIIFTFALLAWAFAEKLSGLYGKHIDKHPVYTLLFIIPALFIYRLALADKKKNFFGGMISWKQGFVSGIYISFFVALISPLSQYVIHTYIAPEFFPNAIHDSVARGAMTLQQAVDYFNLKSYMLQSAFSALSMGVITAAIVALSVKSKNSTS